MTAVATMLLILNVLGLIERQMLRKQRDRWEDRCGRYAAVVDDMIQNQRWAFDQIDLLEELLKEKA